MDLLRAKTLTTIVEIWPRVRKVTDTFEKRARDTVSEFKTGRLHNFFFTLKTLECCIIRLSSRVPTCG